MSVYIKGMEMPKEGYIDVRIKCNGIATFAIADNPYFKAVEAVPVPPHGRLIDADALTETTDGIWDCNDLYFQPNDKICDPNDCKGCKWRETMDCFRRMVKHAPTIIPAEEGET